MSATETVGSTELWPLLDRIIAWLDRLDADSAARGYPDTAGIGLQLHHFETGRLTLGDLRAIRRLVREGAISHHDREPDAITEIAAERDRQVTQEGWTPEHDDGHENGEMAAAAACYAIGSKIETTERGRNSVTRLVSRQIWPWGDEWWKPKTRRRNLIRAAALLVAEIERLNRARDNELARDVVEDRPDA